MIDPILKEYEFEVSSEIGIIDSSILVAGAFVFFILKDKLLVAFQNVLSNELIKIASNVSLSIVSIGLFLIGFFGLFGKKQVLLKANVVQITYKFILTIFVKRIKFENKKNVIIKNEPSSGYIKPGNFMLYAGPKFSTGNSMNIYVQEEGREKKVLGMSVKDWNLNKNEILTFLKNK